MISSCNLACPENRGQNKTKFSQLHCVNGKISDYKNSDLGEKTEASTRSYAVDWAIFPQ